MLPDPLHPAIVHFPVVLAVLVPLAALAVVLASRRRGPSRPGWMAVVALAVLLGGSSWLALETGEQQEEVVESVLASEAPLSQHEDRADQFMVVALAVLALAFVGLAPGRLGSAGRAAATVASLALIPAGVRVGHSGGELVYRHGAAQAHVTGGGLARAPDSQGQEADEEREGHR